MPAASTQALDSTQVCDNRLPALSNVHALIVFVVAL